MILSRIQKIRMILGRSENTFSLLQWLSMTKQFFKQNYILYKKVLLCERNRHTNRGVSSTTQGGVPPLVGVPLARSDGGYPIWGTPHQGTPPARSNGGTQGGVPPSQGTPGQV